MRVTAASPKNRGGGSSSGFGGPVCCWPPSCCCSVKPVKTWAVATPSSPDMAATSGPRYGRSESGSDSTISRTPGTGTRFEREAKNCARTTAKLEEFWISSGSFQSHAAEISTASAATVQRYDIINLRTRIMSLGLRRVGRRDDRRPEVLERRNQCKRLIVGLLALEPAHADERDVAEVGRGFEAAHVVRHGGIRERAADDPD